MPRRTAHCQKPRVEEVRKGSVPPPEKRSGCYANAAIQTTVETPASRYPQADLPRLWLLWRTPWNQAIPPPSRAPFDFGVFDIETQRSAQEVGGWHRADLMRVSCAVVYDSQADEFKTFQEAQITELIDYLGGFDLVVGIQHQTL